ncbi:hypothetical protein M408DRAFT_328537 [Serendipita vermifera MAFF 305830]|uniref:Uncharacterized protein n=1 Tax=Serendipita vermifera MAFF 305830 TaxID=933852 RepID=A0A0C2XKY6_SERVB|nr:hypothetical protein M408DRAFT_328537 [Serendipita vermifera MAFF 305830]
MRAGKEKAEKKPERVLFCNAMIFFHEKNQRTKKRGAGVYRSKGEGNKGGEPLSNMVNP